MKKFRTTIIAMIVLIAMLVSTFNVFAVDNLDIGALQLFLDKLVNMDESNRVFGATILREFLADGDKGIDELKSSIGNLISNETLQEYGYSITDVQDELDRLKNWSQADRAKLVDYIEKGQASKLEELILKNETGNNGGSDGPGAGQTPGNDNDNIPKDSEGELIEINFRDIDSHWAKESIEYLAKRNIIKGKSEGIFDPEGKITRAEFTALIVRLFDLKADANKTMNFNDVKPGAWYYEAVKAAFDNEAITGLSKTSFAPMINVTREQMVTIIIRILEQKELLTNLKKTDKDLGLFNDKEQISNWAIDGMSQAVKYGILSGRSSNILAPKDNATRAEAASIIMKLYNIINN